MADVTGILHHEFKGRTWALNLTLGGIAKLQGIYGRDLGGTLSGVFNGIPPFGMMIHTIQVALEKGEGIAPEEASDLADDMLTADIGLYERVMKSAFPDLRKPGKDRAPKSKA